MWIVFEQTFEGTAYCAIKTTEKWYKVTVTKDDLQHVPGQYDDHTLCKVEFHGDEKILKAKTSDGKAENDHECAQNRDDGDDSGGGGGGG